MAWPLRQSDTKNLASQSGLSQTAMFWRHVPLLPRLAHIPCTLDTQVPGDLLQQLSPQPAAAEREPLVVPLTLPTGLGALWLASMSIVGELGVHPTAAPWGNLNELYNCVRA